MQDHTRGGYYTDESEWATRSRSGWVEEDERRKRHDRLMLRYPVSQDWLNSTSRARRQRRAAPGGAARS